MNAKHRIYGYVRVSSREQNEDRQIIAMKELKIPEKKFILINSPVRTFAARSIGDL